MAEIVSELLMRIFAMNLEQLATHQQNDVKWRKKDVKIAIHVCGFNQFKTEKKIQLWTQSNCAHLECWPSIIVLSNDYT